MSESGSADQTVVVYTPKSELNSQAPKTWIEKTPDVCGGDARIRRTRIPVWLLVEYRQAGLTDSQLLEAYPSLSTADMICAWEYYDRNKKEIDEAINRQEKA
jgi:uncharacterized protein (DUF433 family)